MKITLLEKVNIMGRELKRVPLDFDWPLNKVWGGYINPYQCQSTECPYCKNGWTPEASKLKDQWYGDASFTPEDRGSVPYLPTHEKIWAHVKWNVERDPVYWGSFKDSDDVILREATRLCEIWNTQWRHHLNQNDVNALVEAGRLMDFTHTWSRQDGWKPKQPAYTPTAKEVNEWSIESFGHDAINQNVVVNAECKRLGIKSTCPHCKGSGEMWPTPEIKKRALRYKNIHPPKGHGFQLWENTSEGSPISPVFKTAEDLAEFLSSPKYSCFDHDGQCTKGQWMEFIKRGFAPTLVVDVAGQGVKTGVSSL